MTTQNFDIVALKRMLTNDHSYTILNKSLVFFTKPELPSMEQTVANTILFINISNSKNLNKLTFSRARVTSIKFTKRQILSS